MLLFHCIILSVVVCRGYHTYQGPFVLCPKPKTILTPKKLLPSCLINTMRKKTWVHIYDIHLSQFTVSYRMAVYLCSDSSSCVLPICSKQKIYLFIMGLTPYECFWKVSTIQNVTFLEQALNYIDRHIIKGCWLTEWMTATTCRIASHWQSGCKNYLQPL